MPPSQKDQAEERSARIDLLLEELQLNTEDLHELAHQAFKRAQKAIDDARQIKSESATLRKSRRKPRHSR